MLIKLVEIFDHIDQNGWRTKQLVNRIDENKSVNNENMHICIEIELYQPVFVVISV